MPCVVSNVKVHCKAASEAVSKKESCLLPISVLWLSASSAAYPLSISQMQERVRARKDETMPYHVLHIACCRAVSETVSAKQGGVLPLCGGCLLPTYLPCSRQCGGCLLPMYILVGGSFRGTEWMLVPGAEQAATPRKGRDAMVKQQPMELSNPTMQRESRVSV